MLEIRPYSSAQKGELLAFAAAYPWVPAWPAAELQAFLERLISGPQQLIDVWDGSQRVAAAVLLDKVSNPGRHACLEFLGMVPGLSQALVFNLILTRAETLLTPAQNGIQLGQYQQQGLDQALLRQLGCVPYYDMYEMRCPQPGSLATHCLEPRARRLELAAFDAYYTLLCLAFRDNPDTSLSDFATAREAYARSDRSQIWLIWEQHQPLAFVNLLIEGQAGEIRTLGVHPEARGQGLGKALLGHALALLKAQNKAPCQLSVAVQNQRALGLYLQMGFEVVERSECWLRPIAHPPPTTPAPGPPPGKSGPAAPPDRP